MAEDSEYLSGIDDYSEAIRDVLEEALPELVWDETVKGAAKSAKSTGTIAADSIDFSPDDKLNDEGVISFVIYIQIPDVSVQRLEPLVMKARRVLNDMDDLEGYVKRIEFGVAQGQRGRNPGTAALLFDVKAWL